MMQCWSLKYPNNVVDNMTTWCMLMDVWTDVAACCCSFILKSHVIWTNFIATLCSYHVLHFRTALHILRLSKHMCRIKRNNCRAFRLAWSESFYAEFCFALIHLTPSIQLKSNRNSLQQQHNYTSSHLSVLVPVQLMLMWYKRCTM